jgi:light-regulated signal transduction histidine kinase (bacteriophytochrome)
MLGQAASLLLAPLREAETRAARRARRTILDALPARLARSGLPIAESLAAASELLTLVNATGALVSAGDKLAFAGDLPAPHSARRALAILQVRARGAPLAIDDLALQYPELADCAAKGSGALLLPLDEGTDDAILWFRPELQRSVHWGGNPDEHAIIDPDTHQLAPRRSFAAWKRDVAGRAAPWNAADLLLAREFRDLYAMELARRVSAELARLRDYDQLTGLPKWELLQARLARTGHAHATLLIIAFGQLLNLGETLGPAAADAVVVEIASRLRDAAGPQDELARLDEAQFVLLCGSPGAQAAETMIAHIHQAMREPMKIAGGRTLTPAIRHVVADDAGGLDLADAAYLAMTAAKAHADFTRRLEVQRQKMESLGRMIGGVAHEINNMLQPVALLGQDLLDRGVVPEARETLEIILDCTRQARQIIGDILAFSRPKERLVEYADPAALLEEKLRLVRQAVPADVAIRVEAPAGLPALAVNGTAFAQIVLNLATNATAAMDGRGTLTFRLDEVPADFSSGQMIRLTVIDTGRGMSKETLEHAFEPFFTTKEVGQGTGLGLPVVFGLIDEMGGSIALASELGQGTTVTILLPVAGGGEA